MTSSGIDRTNNVVTLSPRDGIRRFDATNGATGRTKDCNCVYVYSALRTTVVFCGADIRECKSVFARQPVLERRDAPEKVYRPCAR